MASASDKNRGDIANVMATLAERQGEGAKPSRNLTGPERAAVLMLALGDQYGGKIWELLDDDELRELSIVMSTLGTVEILAGRRPPARIRQPPVRLRLADGQLRSDRTPAVSIPCRRIASAASWTRSAAPAGRNMWEKLSNVQEDVLANYLKNEYPQTIAVVLSKLRPEHSARVLAILPEDIALDVVNRMLRMEAIQKEVIDRVEQTLRTEFMSNISKSRRRDAHEVMAEIFNNFDRQTETRFLTSLEEDNRDSAPNASRR